MSLEKLPENDYSVFNPKSIRIYQPSSSSHKGQNGKLLVIGGSRLFHSSIFWSADVASKIVDLVHLTSPANENNQIFRHRLKQKFWNGIVVDWADVEDYIQEDDCILIGPGMIRDSEFSEHSENSESRISSENQRSRKSENPALRLSGNQILRSSEYSEFSDRTSIIVNSLLRKYSSKRWVIDGGGLQEVESGLITESCILTPHRKEFLNLADKCYKNYKDHNLKRSDLGVRQGRTLSDAKHCVDLSKYLNNCTILLKGRTDIVCQGNRCTQIAGGNPGMTKGGTGDVLAGLVAALYCKNDCWTAATVGSWVNKTAGDELCKKVGPYFNAGDLVNEIPNILVKV